MVRVLTSRNAHQMRETRRQEQMFPIRPWGPFCYLRQERHPEPFNKRRDGKLRRDAKQYKLRRRLDSLPERVHDDGWFTGEAEC